MTDARTHYGATFEPVASSDGVAGFDGVLGLAKAAIEMSFTLLDDAKGEVRPFAFIAEGPDVYQVKWDRLELEDPWVDFFLETVVPSTLASRDPHIVGLFLTTYLTSSDEEQFEAALLSVVATDWQRARELSTAARIQRPPGQAPRLDDWPIVKNEVAPAIGRALYGSMFGPRRDRGRSSETDPPNAQRFRLFAEEAVPDALGPAIEQVGEEWDGSPWLLLARPETPDLDFFLITGEPGIESLRDIREAVRNLDDPPVAAALAFSGPLIGPTGMVPKEGMLSILCADDQGRQSFRCRRLHTDENGHPAVSQLPPDVEGEAMPGDVTRWFMAELLVLCGAIRNGDVDASSGAWEALLNEAKGRDTRSN